MRKLGLKVFSINRAYCEPARELHARGVFDFIELYVVPGTFANTIGFWKDFTVPFVIHASHFKHGVNLARRDCEAVNRGAYEEAARFADALHSRYIIFHPGIGGDIRETVRQLALIDDKRILIENKPYHTIQDKNVICNGYSPRDIRLVMDKSGCGFCMDVGHCFCAAKAVGRDAFEYLADFLNLRPVMAHLMDNMTDTTVDRHLHLGNGDYDVPVVLSMLPDNMMITIETDKDSEIALDDFVRDVQRLRKLEKSV